MDDQLSKCSNSFVSESVEANKSQQEFSCNECDNKFDTIEKLKSHKISKHVTSKLNCKHCNFQGKTSAEMESHIKTHSISSNSIYICEDCNFQDVREENILNHRIAKHAKHSCDKCDYQTSIELELKMHKLQVHGMNTKPLFQCDVCEFADNKDENVLNHKIANHSVKVCEMCEYESEDVQKLSDHIRTIHQQTKFTCNLCLIPFKTQTNLRDHIKSQHKPSSFPCDYCGQKVDSLSSLDKHIEAYHRISKTKTNVTDFNNKTPCDFKSPQHVLML